MPRSQWAATIAPPLRVARRARGRRRSQQTLKDTARMAETGGPTGHAGPTITGPIGDAATQALADHSGPDHFQIWIHTNLQGVCDELGRQSSYVTNCG